MTLAARDTAGLAVIGSDPVSGKRRKGAIRRLLRCQTRLLMGNGFVDSSNRKDGVRRIAARRWCRCKLGGAELN